MSRDPAGEGQPIREETERPRYEPDYDDLRGGADDTDDLPRTGEAGPERAPRDPAAERDDEDRPRRRRRGRRGGRGRRARTEGDRLPAATDREPPPRGGPPDDDEPLPAGYGVRPASRSEDGDRDDAERPADPAGRRDADGGEVRGRRRRRRGEGRSSATPRSTQRRERGAAAGREGASDRRRSRRGSESRSSGYARGRRDDFAPVAGGRDEDDEGLEFLGVEEAGQEPQRRQRSPEDEDILAESGLSTVLDVPSWVEAIGIVIAGNLDARSRSGRGDGGSRR